MSIIYNFNLTLKIGSKHWADETYTFKKKNSVFKNLFKIFKHTVKNLKQLF